MYVPIYLLYVAKSVLRECDHFRAQLYVLILGNLFLDWLKIVHHVRNLSINQKAFFYLAYLVFTDANNANMTLPHKQNPH